MTGPDAAAVLAGLIRLEVEGRRDEVHTLVVTLDASECGAVLLAGVMVLAEQLSDRAELRGVDRDVVLQQMLVQVGLA